jgi:hypothetical protein
MGREARAARREGQGEGRAEAAERPHCGLCGKHRKPLRQTDCCGRTICDDEDDYQMFSYARNSCSRNHRRYTLCGIHHAQRHRGPWQSCKRCREEPAEVEMYVWYGTNKYNFEKLENPPAYEPTRCVACGRVIVLGEEGYSVGPEGYRCEACFED